MSKHTVLLRTVGGGAKGNSSTQSSVGAITPTSVAGTAGVTSSGAGNGVGYTTGAGQATSKSTGVTLSKPCGQITTNAAALAAATSVGLTLTNSVIAATDVVAVSISSATTVDSYQVTVDAIAAGSCATSRRLPSPRRDS